MEGAKCSAASKCAAESARLPEYAGDDGLAFDRVRIPLELGRLGYLFLTFRQTGLRESDQVEVIMRG